MNKQLEHNNKMMFVSIKKLGYKKSIVSAFKTSYCETPKQQTPALNIKKVSKFLQ